MALALLIANVAPILLVLLTWALGGAPPTRRAALLMGFIMLGLVFALYVPEHAWARLPETDTGPEQAACAYYGAQQVLPVPGSQCASSCPQCLRQATSDSAEGGGAASEL